MTARPVRYVTISRFAELTGYTQKAVRRKYEDGVWREGSIIRKAPDGCILIGLEEYERWLEADRAAAPHGTTSAASGTTTGSRH